MTTTAKATLWQCSLSIDALTAVRTLTINGQEYDYGRVPGGWWLERRAKRRQRWTVLRGVCNGSCDCPASYFRNGPCKHVLAARTGILEIGQWNHASV